jgi:hypothetical protein
MRSKRQRPEAAEQIKLLLICAERLRPDVVVFSVPNSTWTTPLQAQKMKSEGATAGAPDLIFVADGLFHGLEMKPLKGGRVSDSQVSFHARLRAAGVGDRIRVAYGCDHAVRILEAWGLMR